MLKIAYSAQHAMHCKNTTDLNGSTMSATQYASFKGILNPRAVEQKFKLSRIAPSGELTALVEHFWIVSWDLRGQPSYTSETLPHPSVHLVIEAHRAEVIGIMRGKFSRRLHGTGRAFGIKFRPGAFYPLLGAPVSQLTDRRVGLRTIFGVRGTAFRNAIQREQDEARCVAIAEAFLKTQSITPDPTREWVCRAVEKIMLDRSLVHVDQLATFTGATLRSLQRLFRKYVGISPKWVIKRYRLHEAAEELAKNSGDVADLALRLGYFDQAHFIRDFKSVVGKTPGVYARLASK